MSDLVELTIDGKQVAVAKGTLLVAAAKQVGIEIPVFCHHEKLKPVGACRMCLVEIEKMPRLQTACTTPVGPGMVVRTTSPAAKEAQQGVLELLLANHPLDCPICDKGGECPLQDNAFRYGGGGSRLSEAKRANEKALPLSDLIVLDRERCILCYRCTRFQEEIAGDGALVALDRGGDSEIGTLDGEPFDSPFSGNTVEICPVGALTSRQYRFRARPWDLQHTGSVCSGCSVGCNVTLDARDRTIVRVMGRADAANDDGWLCDTGRYRTAPHPAAGPHVAPGAKARVRWPLVRENGQLQRTTIDVAVARALRSLRAQGSALLLSARLSNEALRIAAAELPAALPQTKIGFAEPVLSPWPVEGRITNLPRCRKIVDLGCDPWTSLPVLALWLRKATTAGGVLVAVGPSNGLFRDSKHWLRAEPADFAAACEELAAALTGGKAGPEATAAAASLRADGPAAVLLGARFAADPRALAAGVRIAEALGADGATGLVGAPMRGANARGAAELAPALARTDALAGRPGVVLSFGCEPPVLVPGGVNIVATSGDVPVDPSVDVVLPLAHPYETDGHFTSLDGRQQQLVAAVRNGADVRMDHELLRELLKATATTAVAGGTA